jgi:hypothetical protein
LGDGPPSLNDGQEEVCLISYCRTEGIPVVDALMTFDSAVLFTVVRVKSDWDKITGLTVDDFIKSIASVFWEKRQHLGHTCDKIIVVGEDVDASKVHLDGYDQTARLKGEGPGTRSEFHYITDDGDYAAFRYGKWKISFLTQECNGFDVWDCEYKAHRAPRVTNLRADPYEEALQPGASFYWQDWMFRRS